VILRRVTEHVRTQNWTAVALDFVIVVAGVFLGLQVQEWSKQQDDHQRERQIVADMLADLEIDRAQYANAMALAVRRVAAANASLQAADLPPIEFEYKVPNSDIVSYAFDIPEAADIPPARREQLWTDLGSRARTRKTHCCKSS
jgi:hypothetical protein